MCFLHGMRVCIWFGYKLLEHFCHFFHIVNLVNFQPQYMDNGYLLWAQFLLQFGTDRFETLQFFFIVWGCACGLGIIVRIFFPHCKLSHFSPSIYRHWVPLVSATPLTVLYRSFWNFAYIFFMVWGYACGLVIIVRSFLSGFPHCELSHFSPLYINSCYPLWAQLLLQFCTDYYETLHVFSSWYEDLI